MGGKQSGYKGVEGRSLEKDEEEIKTIHNENNENTYKVVGFAHKSNSGKALNVVLKDSTGEKRLITISKSDIIDAFKFGSSPCVIEYNLTKEQKDKEIEKNDYIKTGFKTG
jgi:hypothetical protein